MPFVNLKGTQVYCMKKWGTHLPSVWIGILISLGCFQFVPQTADYLAIANSSKKK